MTETITGRLQGKRVCVTGGAGFLGRAVCARLTAAGVTEVFVPRSCEYDLTRADAVARLYDDTRPDIVLHLAAEVGGIGANEKHPGRFFYANLAMGMHLIEEARKHDVEKFIQVGTVCAYPKHCAAPFVEKDLWAGFPEATNAPYGIAKRALHTMLEAYSGEYGFNGVYLISANLYGQGDNFDLETSHVIPALIRKFCEAVDRNKRTVTCWGTGKVTREFLFVDDAADAIVTAAAIHDDPKPINIGTGHEITIRELAETIAELCGFRGEITWDHTRPDGQPVRRLDISRAEDKLSWHPKVSFADGLSQTVDWWRDIGSTAVQYTSNESWRATRSIPDGYRL